MHRRPPCWGQGDTGKTVVGAMHRCLLREIIRASSAVLKAAFVNVKRNVAERIFLLHSHSHRVERRIEKISRVPRLPFQPRVRGRVLMATLSDNDTDVLSSTRAHLRIKRDGLAFTIRA